MRTYKVTHRSDEGLENSVLIEKDGDDTPTYDEIINEIRKVTEQPGEIRMQEI